jgi:hypothetical protein
MYYFNIHITLKLLGHLEVSEFHKKKTLIKFRKFGIIFFYAIEVFFFFNKNFHENLPEAGRLRELDYKQYEFERFNQCIIMHEI